MTPGEPPYEIPPRITETRETGGRVVFTNGCFDLLHPGHVSYLRMARSLGDALVVGLNSDASVRKFKGPSRPIVPERDRATVLEALESVDAVVVFGEDAPVRLLRELRPAVYVKGGDYRIEDLPEAEVAAEIGAEVKILPFEPGYSSSALIEKIQALPSTNMHSET
ncbi:MAG: D-glycero-beta-D-manno-heptose 1-phosphate adenylyltransferase [Actinobacteria bacterium]|nr:D-glycero-beta-D-manno-heptose 1-phosphate adenylyltransferase [Actinomycetota bacterium]